MIFPENDCECSKILWFQFERLRQLVCSVMYIMPPFPVFQELPDFARFFGKTGFRKNYLSLLQIHELPKKYNHLKR